MPRQPRRNHTPAFKAKVAFAAIKGDQTLAQLAEQFDVHSNQITAWKAQLEGGAADVFGPGGGRTEARMNATRRDALLKEYSEVGNNFRLLTDIRFKLLGLLPIAAAAAAALKGDALDTKAFGLSLFGLVATLGLATYNARNDQLYDELVGRAASIERSLGLPDGYFANRPRAWLEVPLGKLRWPIDHRTGVTTIYAASVALWTSGVLAPVLEFVRRVNLPRFAVIGPAIGVNISAIALAIILTALGVLFIGTHKKRRARKLRKWAAEAVKTAAELPLETIGESKRLLSLCVSLSGEKTTTISSRAKFYAKLDADSVGYYLPAGPQLITAAHIVALLTDLPARWLFDCATNRRGSLSPDKESDPRQASYARIDAA